MCEHFKMTHLKAIALHMVFLRGIAFIIHYLFYSYLGGGYVTLWEWRRESVEFQQNVFSKFLWVMFLGIVIDMLCSTYQGRVKMLIFMWSPAYLFLAKLPIELGLEFLDCSSGLKLGWNNNKHITTCFCPAPLWQMSGEKTVGIDLLWVVVELVFLVLQQNKKVDRNLWKLSKIGKGALYEDIPFRIHTRSMSFRFDTIFLQACIAIHFPITADTVYTFSPPKR